MCKFCDSLKEKSLVSYDNSKNMNISYGQYQGVNVYGTVYMKGNMLSIGCCGSYRSRSDCYYDAEGLDCDNEYSSNSEPNYIQIAYCPFCGRKLEDHTYEKQKAIDDIKELKEKLKWLEQDLRDYDLIITCHCQCNKRVLHNVEVFPGEFGDRIEYDYIEYDNGNPLNINEISEIFPKVSINMYYGCPQNDWNKRILPNLPEFTLNTKMKYGSYYNGQYNLGCYRIKDEMYFKLVELGYIKHNKEKYDDLKKEQEIIMKDIINVKNNIKKLEHYLKTLK
jgi:hypothetical protein